jgi:hypothetical protein
MIVRQATREERRRLASCLMPAGPAASGRRASGSRKRSDNGIWATHADGVEIVRWIR